ncbi:MFS transporter [Marinivivus vitaminiproducens]|uniref:MFS transporter n=1 Tax=Marinivivus vitaminiproducens TaxID=3035935 RepID=UPI003F9F6818
MSTRMAFLVAGLGMAAWAPLVPFAKDRAGLDEASLGLLLLCLGLGSLIGMPLTGVLVARYGCRAVILPAGVLACASLLCLASVPTAAALAVSLLLYGAAIGILDVAMNIQAVIVEKAERRPLMSGFHALFSVGGIVGAGGMSLLLWLGLAPFVASAIVVAVMATLLAAASAWLLRFGDEAGGGGAHFVLPHGPVILIGLLCFIIFLAEGAMLDWSALFLQQERALDPAHAGIGYTAFAIAMTLGRFTGDRVVQALGRRRMLLLGSLCAAAGFILASAIPSVPVSLAGFVLVGLGAANIVPILFTAAGRQNVMPSGQAVAAVTTLGYAGILAGPASIGLIAHASSLTIAFAALGAGLLLIAVNTRIAQDG